MCFYPLGESRSKLCACQYVASFGNRNGVVRPDDVPQDCKDAVTSLAFTEGCVEMQAKKRRICNTKKFLFDSWKHSCRGLELSLRDVCEKKQRVRRYSSADMFRFRNTAIDSSEGADEFTMNWDAHLARFKEINEQVLLKPSTLSSSSSSSSSPSSRGTYSNLENTDDIASAMLEQPIALSWVDPRFICEDGKPMLPRRGHIIEPIGKSKSVWLIHGGVSISGGLNMDDPEDRTSLFNSVHFASTSIPARSYELNDSFLLIERFNDPNTECWAPQPFFNDTDAKVAEDTSYPNRTRAPPLQADDGCGEDNPAGLEQGNDNCCSPTNQCSENHGNCKTDQDCAGTLVCGYHNCPWKYRVNASVTPDNCCWSPYLPGNAEIRHGAFTMDEKT